MISNSTDYILQRFVAVEVEFSIIELNLGGNGTESEEGILISVGGKKLSFEQRILV